MKVKLRNKVISECVFFWVFNIHTYIPFNETTGPSKRPRKKDDAVKAIIRLDQEKLSTTANEIVKRH